MSDDVDDELPPLSVLDDMMADVAAQLEGVADLLAAHRHAAGTDYPVIERLRDVSMRVDQAWAATVTARRALRA
jgi:hypothetical protein